MGAEPANRHPDALIARIAARQHGVITVAQLERFAVRRRGIAARVRAGRLHRVHRGVYAVGHEGLSREGRWMAAVLACGTGSAPSSVGAVLSHTSAGELWGILRTPAGAAKAEARSRVSHVTVPGSSGRAQRKGIRVHRSLTLDPGQVTRRLAIPVTTPSRTLVDLRRLLSQRGFAAALRQAEFLGLPIDARLEPDRTRSELEARFLALCRRHRLPAPEVNVGIGRFIVDFAWPRHRLIVELDGYRTHRGRAAFEADRDRDLELKLRGYDVVRLTWRAVEATPGETAARLRKLLARSGRRAR